MTFFVGLVRDSALRVCGSCALLRDMSDRFSAFVEDPWEVLGGVEIDPVR